MQSNVPRWILPTILLFYTFSAIADPIGESRRSSIDKLEVEVSSEAKDSSRQVVNIVNRASGERKQVALDSEYDNIVDVSLMGDCIYLRASFGSGGLESLIRINGESASVEFEYSGRSFSYSPSHRWVVYESFFPVHPVEDQVFPTINLVDTHIKQRDEMAIFPIGGYGQIESPKIKKWFAVSPILWKEDSTAFCFLSRYGWFASREDSELHLIAIRIDQNGNTSIVDQQIYSNDFTGDGASKPLRSWRVSSLVEFSPGVLRATFDVSGGDRVVDIPFAWK